MVETLEFDPSEKPDLLVNQKKTIRLMRRSHRFLMAHIFGNVFGIYIVMLWVVLTIWMMNLPFHLFSLATIIIALPILIAPLQYKDTKNRFNLLQEAGALLHDTERAVDASQFAQGLTSYIFLIFDILRPSNIKSDNFEENEVEQVRTDLNSLTRKTLREFMVQAFFLTALIIFFLIPEFIDVIESGGAFLFPLIFLCFVIGLLMSRWLIFLYWRFLIRRWLRFYRGFMNWGAELERMFSQPSESEPGGSDV
jgi:hypothetical protein